MIKFYCVGFPDLTQCFARHGHVQSHRVYLSKDEAEKEAEGKVISVHEFQARNQAHVDCLVSQYNRMLASIN